MKRKRPCVCVLEQQTFKRKKALPCWQCGRGDPKRLAQIQRSTA